MFKYYTMWLIIGGFLVVVGVIVLSELWNKRGSRWRRLNTFSGDYPLPFFGNALQLGFDADDAANKLMALWRKHGKSNFRMTVGSEEWVLLSEPDDIGTILSHPTELAKSPERNAAMMPFFGNSVSTSEGARWRLTRKLMTPSFHFKTLETRIEAVNKRCSRLLEILSDYEDKGPVDMYRYLRPFMFDILCSTLMGVDYDLLEDPDHPYLAASGRVIDIVNRNYFSYWRNVSGIFMLTPMYREMMAVINTIRNTSTEIIYQRRKKLEQIINITKDNNKVINGDLNKIIQDKIEEESCLLDNLMINKLPGEESFTDEMINEEISLLCFTGHYTTTLTMSHTLYCLAKYPHIQQRVFEEQQSIFNSGDKLRNPTNQDLNEMKYLEAVIKESIRVIPTVTKIGRQIESDMELKDGRVIPAGCTVIVYYEAMFQNDKVFPEPQTYDPERFFHNLPAFSFVPFSAGPRNCIGFRYAWVAMKATLSNILRRYEVTEADPSMEPQFAHRIITESKNGVRLNIKRRT